MTTLTPEQTQAAVELLQELVEDKPEPRASGGAMWNIALGMWQCIYCRERWDAYRKPNHKPRCPVARAQALLTALDKDVE
jgi:hypothetical protein